MYKNGLSQADAGQTTELSDSLCSELTECQTALAAAQEERATLQATLQDREGEIEKLNTVVEDLKVCNEWNLMLAWTFGCVTRVPL